MMKRLFLFILTVSMWMPVFADVVGKDEALGVANRFFAADAHTHAGKAVLVSEGFGSGRYAAFECLDFVKTAKTVAAPDPSYYVFNNLGEGWVIIAGDDSVSPVLAYSREGSFSCKDMPDNLQWWMDLIDAHVLQSRNKGGQRVSLWDAPFAGGTPVIELETALWDQIEPFNWESPSYKGRVSYTGCVATAAAIVCRYHQWPPYGKGTLPGYVTNSLGIKIPENALGREYNYKKMPLSYGRFSSREQGEAVAALMYDLGTSAFMDFTSDGSGAYTEDLLAALKKHFGYQASARFLWREDFTDYYWLETLKKELKENGPVLYGGYTEDAAGHQFVFDGYDTKDYFHVNWGWGGYGNGYFRITELGNSSTDVFSLWQNSVFDLKPDYGAYAMTPEMIADKTSFSYDRESNVIAIDCRADRELNYSFVSQSGIVVKSGTISRGNPVKIEVSGVEKGTYTLSIWEETPYALTVKL